MRTSLVTATLAAVVLASVAAPAAAVKGDGGKAYAHGKAMDQAKNSASYWQTSTTRCTKVELGGADAYLMPAPVRGGAWTLLVLKAGSGARAHAVVEAPQAGVAYTHPTGKDIGHVITCVGRA